MSFRWVWMVGFMAVAVAPGHGRADEASTVAVDAAIERAVGRVYPALVRIHVVTENAGSGRMNKERASGSGVIVRKDGYIITNHHVAGRGRRFMCRLADGEEVEADLMGTDALSDIAVIRLRMKTRSKELDLAVAEFGDSDRLRVGDTVLAMGSPGGVAQSVTQGIISNPAMILPGGGGLRLDGEDVGSLVRWIAHDAQIFGGNSGGPLVSLEGRIVGINEIGFAGLGGAIPGNLARSVADQLIDSGRVERSWIGVTTQPRPKSLAVSEGILVGGVLPDSPAETAGLRAGDVLVEFDGVRIDCAIPEDVPVFNSIVLSTPIGKTVDVAVLRDGEVVRTKMTTRRRDAARGDDAELRAWGITARNFTLFSAIENLRDDLSGVLVSTVRPGGPAAQAEPAIQSGDVLVAVEGKPIRSLEHLLQTTERLTRDRTEPRPTLAAFDRGRSRYLAVVRIGTPEKPDKPERSRRPDFPAILQSIPNDLAEALGVGETGGIRIAYVFPGLSVDQAGIRQGDVLLKFDGEPVRAPRPEDVFMFTQYVRQYRIGSVVPVDLLRDGTPVSVKITLAEASDTAEEPDRHEDLTLDFSVRSLTLMDRALRKIPDSVQGVLVERVERASTPALADLREDDLILSIDGQPTPDVPSAEAALAGVAKAHPRYVMIFVRRGVYTMFIELEPDWNGIESAGAPEPAERDVRGKRGRGRKT